jgi:hypothetical protein
MLLKVEISRSSHSEDAAEGEQMTMSDREALQRIVDFGAKIRIARQFVAIAKDWNKPTRDFFSVDFTADQWAGNSITFEELMKPLGPCFVMLAVTDEGPVAPLIAWRIATRDVRHDGSSLLSVFA